MKYPVLITATSSYFIGCAFLYAQGFWSVFGVPVLQFAGLEELIRFGLHGLMVLLLSMAVALVLSLFCSAYFHILAQDGWKVRWHDNPRNGPLSWIETGLLLTSNLFIVAILLTIVVIEAPDKWMYTASLLLLAILVFPLRIIPIYVNRFKSVVPPFVLSPLLAVFVTTPVVAYWTGLNQAEQLKHRTIATYTLVMNQSEDERRTFLGRLGSKYFFFDQEDETLLIKVDTETLEMRRALPRPAPIEQIDSVSHAPNSDH